MTRFTNQKYVTLGGQRLEAAPMDLERTVQLALLLSPYVPLLEEYRAQFVAALGSKRRPRLLSAIFRSLAREMQQTPGDIVKMVAVLAGREADWVARNVKPSEIVAALPVWDDVNDLGALLDSVKALGIKVEING